MNYSATANISNCLEHKYIRISSQVGFFPVSLHFFNKFIRASLPIQIKPKRVADLSFKKQESSEILSNLTSLLSQTLLIGRSSLNIIYNYRQSRFSKHSELFPVAIEIQKQSS